ncbi:hypothetical protein PIB30_049416 [Stylosanthes scabra]|uniref:Uncharacterized protein n=1 Tax=Stylosanthes scabra TaxID=79078 RepID=A0ABU6QHT0_9FABA|nr:hypothetical protein [Stylosanthes scabra]
MEEIPINDEWAGESSNPADPGKRSRPKIEKFHSLGTLQANRWRMYKILIFKKEQATPPQIDSPEDELPHAKPSGEPDTDGTTPEDELPHAKPSGEPDFEAPPWTDPLEDELPHI